MKKKILEESVKNRLKKLAGINEARWPKFTYRTAAGHDKEWDEYEDEYEEPKKLSKQTATPEDVYRRISYDAVTQVEKEMNVTDGWERSFVDKLKSNLLPDAFVKQNLDTEHAKSESRRRAEKFISSYRKWFADRGLTDYRSAVTDANMNYQQQVEWEKPLFDMLNNIANEPPEEQKAPEIKPDKDMEDLYTMKGDSDLSKRDIRQQNRQQKDLERRGMFGQGGLKYGRKGFVGMAEGKIRIKRKNQK